MKAAFNNPFIFAVFLFALLIGSWFFFVMKAVEHRPETVPLTTSSGALPHSE